jgi:hypothetical protein
MSVIAVGSNAPLFFFVRFFSVFLPGVNGRLNDCCGFLLWLLRGEPTFFRSLLFENKNENKKLPNQKKKPDDSITNSSEEIT